jgi:hypothetical protein
VANRGLGQLTLDLVTKIGGFTAPLDQAQRKLQSTTASMNKSAIAIGTAIGHFLSEGIEGIAHFVEGTVTASVELAHLSEKTGLSAKAIGGLRVAAAESGVDMDRLGKTITKVAGIQFDAASGSKDAAAEMKFFGITAKDTADNALDKLIKGFNSLPPSFDRAGLAVKIFGERLGTDFLLIADQAKGGLSGLEQQAADLGVQLDEKTLKSAEQFEVSMGIVRLQMQAVGEQIAGEVIPILNDFVKALADPQINAEFKSIASIAIESFATVIEWAGKAELAIAGIARHGAAVNFGAALGDQGELEKENARIKERLALIKSVADQAAGPDPLKKLFVLGTTDPFVTQKTGQLTVPLDQEQKILQQRLAINEKFLSQGVEDAKQAAAAKAAADKAAADAAEADAKKTKDATAAQQAAYKALMAQLNANRHTVADHSKEIAAAALRFKELFESVQGGLDGPLEAAQAHANKQLDEFAHLAEVGKVSAHDLADANDAVAESLARISDSIQAQAAGPLQEENFQYSEQVRLLKDAKLSADDEAEALKRLTREHEKNVDSIKRELDPLGAFIADQQFELDLLGQTNAQRVVSNQLRDIERGMTEEQAKAFEKENAAKIESIKQNELLIESQRKQIAAMDDMRSSFEDIFVSVADGQESLLKGLKDFADAFVKELLRMAAAQASAALFGEQGTIGGGSIGGWFSKMFSLFSGNSISGSSSASSSSGLLGAGLGVVGGFASGTDFAPGGLAWVGEKGPELVRLPRGAQVYPAAQSERMASGGGITFVNNWPPGTTMETVDQANARMGRTAQLALARNSR